MKAAASITPSDAANPPAPPAGYAQYLNGQTNFDAAVQGSIKAQALLAVQR